MSEGESYVVSDDSPQRCLHIGEFLPTQLEIQVSLKGTRLWLFLFIFHINIQIIEGKVND